MDQLGLALLGIRIRRLKDHFSSRGKSNYCMLNFSEKRSIKRHDGKVRPRTTRIPGTPEITETTKIPGTPRSP